MKVAAASFVLGLAIVGGCTSEPSVPPSATAPTGGTLYVQNIDGPPVELLLGTEAIGVVFCTGSATFTSGAGFPPWPWHLTVRATDGGPMNGQTEAVVDVGVVPGDWTLLIRGRGTAVALGHGGPIGPAPNTCPPVPIPSS